MFRCVTSDLAVLMLPMVLLVLLMPISWSFQALTPGCHLYREWKRPHFLWSNQTYSYEKSTNLPLCLHTAFNVTIRTDKRGTCRGTQLVYACVGYCESSAFPSRYSVLLASNFTRNITSASRCCTISKDAKVQNCHHRLTIIVLLRPILHQKNQLWTIMTKDFNGYGPLWISGHNFHRPSHAITIKKNCFTVLGESFQNTLSTF